MVAYEREENKTRMRMSKMMGWNIWITIGCGGDQEQSEGSLNEKSASCQDKQGT